MSFKIFKLSVWNLWIFLSLSSFNTFAQENPPQKKTIGSYEYWDSGDDIYFQPTDQLLLGELDTQFAVKDFSLEEFQNEAEKNLPNEKYLPFLANSKEDRVVVFKIAKIINVDFKKIPSMLTLHSDAEFKKSYYPDQEVGLFKQNQKNKLEVLKDYGALKYKEKIRTEFTLKEDLYSTEDEAELKKILHSQ